MNVGTKTWDLLNSGVADGVFPGAVLLVSRAGHRLCFQAVGQAAIVPSPRPMTVDTVFDLASLTKPLATTLAVLILVSGGGLRLDASLTELLRSPSLPPDKAGITLRQLLSHSAGFPAWKPYYLELEGLRQTERKRRVRELLLEEPLDYPPGVQRSRVPPHPVDCGGESGHGPTPFHPQTSLRTPGLPGPLLPAS
jgi:CubicO group peptidase (beta-lactamase class C family)